MYLNVAVHILREGASERARERGAQVLAQASEIAEAEIASRSSKRAAQRLLATSAFARRGAGSASAEVCIVLKGNGP